MKKIMIFLVVIIIYNPLICQSPSPCGEILDCSETETAHRYCTPKGIVVKCVQNPYTTEWGLPLRIPAKNMPICLNFIDSGPDSVYGVWGCYECHDLTISYRKSDFEYDMNWSLDEWLCLCGMEDEDCQCEIDIKFDDNPSNFYYSETLTSNNTLNLKEDDLINGFCEIDCSELEILLNYTDNFCGAKDGSDAYDHFFVSSSTPGYQEGIFHYVNLRGVITYQLAHIFGFGFIPHSPYNPSNCFDEFGIMNADYLLNASNNLERSGGTHQLTQQDKCSFMKLYCPDIALLLVEEELKEVQSQGSIFYNKLNLNFETNIFSEKVNFELYNLLGKKVMALNEYNLDAGEHTISINSENLEPGIYFVTIKSESQSQTKKIIIIK